LAHQTTIWLANTVLGSLNQDSGS